VHRPFLRRLTIAGAALLATILLSACGGNNNEDTSRGIGVGQPTPSSSATFNSADVSFTSEMILHHQQAVEMAQMAEQRASNAQVKQLATRIVQAQEPEIATMSGWLRRWGEPMPSPSTDQNGQGGDDGPGMMTDQEMKDLEAASGTDFDRMFLQMMIRHHQGAVEMADAEQQQGQDPQAKQLATKISRDQTAEINEMQDLLTKI
jgi:uncharacterized protein (DUF305 family)